MRGSRGTQALSRRFAQPPLHCWEKIGPAGLEPETPCLEGGFRAQPKFVCFHGLLFQAVVAIALRFVARRCTRRHSTATNLSTKKEQRVLRQPIRTEVDSNGL